MAHTPIPRNRAKIICTLGPATATGEAVRALAEAGMDVARLNFSHGTHAQHLAYIQMVRDVAREVGKPIAILQDLSGPKLRTGPMAEGAVTLDPGRRFVLTARAVPGGPDEVALGWPGLVREVQPDDRLLLADGSVALRVEEVTDADIVCWVQDGGVLGSNAGINVPGRVLHLPALTEKDQADLAFGLRMGVDWVALSFVQSGDDIARLRARMEATPCRAPIMAKIEKAAALDQLDAILLEADGVMVARGDLGVEIPMRDVPWAQKEVIRKANAIGIPVVTATQMLESMLQNPRPTRAEMTDIANAILDGSDAIMLSGETAVGKHPIDAVRVMRELAETATVHIDGTMDAARRPVPASITDAIGAAACQVARQVEADFIICCTRSGQTARTVAKYRPPMPIIAVSHNERVLRELQLCWGTVPLAIPEPKDTDEIIAAAKSALLLSGMARLADRVVIVAGIPLDAHGTTNMIKADVL
jgi:pyruvate kinase